MRSVSTAQIVNYADDFVICCKGTADEAMTVMRGMMSKLKLTVNETKTRLCHLPDESFDFLGYTLGRNYDCRTGESYSGTASVAEENRPALPGDWRADDAKEGWARRRGAGGDDQPQVKGLVQLLSPWDGEQSLPESRQPRPPSGAPVVVREVQGTGSGKTTVPRPTSVPEAGTTPASTNVTAIVRGRTCEAAYENSLVRKPGAGKPHARFDERDVETEHGEASEAPATERAGNRYAKPKTTAHISTLLLVSGRSVLYPTVA